MKKGAKMQKRLELISQILDEKKAENIQLVDMSSNPDYPVKAVVIATTLTARHGEALIDELKTRLKPLGEEFLGVETADEWSVADLGDIFIHLMSESLRAKYDLETLLGELAKPTKSL